jgi:hypothetical protein
MEKKDSRSLKEASSSSPQGGERRQCIRLNVAKEQFCLRDTGKVFSVDDLSLSGMGVRILDPEDLALFSAGRKLEGILNLRGEKVPVQGQVAHVRRDRVGISFADLDESSGSILRKFMDPEVLGRELQGIPHSTPGMLWYHGPSGTDVFFQKSKNQELERIFVLIHGFYIQWNEEGLETGAVSHSEDASQIQGVLRHDSILLDRDKDVDFVKLEIAKKLILSSNLPQQLQTESLSCLQPVS